MRLVLLVAWIAAPRAAAGEPPRAAPDAAVTPDVPEAPADAAAPDPARASEAAARLYLDALAAWNGRRWDEALGASSSALLLDPELAPARLLAVYALLRLHRPDEAVTAAHGLALHAGAPLPADTRREAARVVRRGLRPYGRDAWRASIGPATYGSRAGRDTGLRAGGALSVQAPLGEGVGVRLDLAAPWARPFDALDVAGPRYGLAGAVAQPLGAGRWSVDLGLGPVLWVASGRYWADGGAPFVGVRGFGGLDVRIGPVVGLGVEVGATAQPGQLEALPSVAQPIDVRVSLDVWVGGGRSAARAAVVAPPAPAG